MSKYVDQDYDSPLKKTNIYIYTGVYYPTSHQLATRVTRAGLGMDRYTVIGDTTHISDPSMHFCTG